MVKISYRYCISLKNTYNADRINPTPILKSVSVIIGYISKRNLVWKGTPSIAANRKNITNVSPKLISDDMFLENRNRYLGTFILVNIPLLAISDCIPVLVDSLKNKNTFRPANTYTIKWGISRPKKCVKTRTMTASCNKGPNKLHRIPSAVRLYRFLKSRLTNSSKRKLFINGSDFYLSAIRWLYIFCNFYYIIIIKI